MITTKITIENYLAEYLIGKYGTPDSKVVRLPSDLDLYHFVYDLLQKRPAGCPVDSGNLELVLPERREAHLPGGKPLATYNYIGERGAKILSRKINDTQTVTMCVPTCRFHLDMLANHIETEIFRLLYIIQQSLVCGSCIQSVGPPTLVQRSKLEQSLVI